MPEPESDVWTAEQPLLTIRVEVCDSVAVVRVAGECDASVSSRLANALRDARDGSRTVHLDVRDLTFLDSATLQVLYQANARLQADGSRLVLVDPQPGIRRVLQIAGLDGAFDVRDSARELQLDEA